MIKKLIGENVLICDEVSSWEEAIRLASEGMRAQGKIEGRYVDAMIENIRTLGPYMVLTEGVAMPHSRPEDGVNETSMAFLKLNKKVDFAGEPVNILFVLASRSSDEHVEAIQAMTELLGDEERMKIIESEENLEKMKELIY